MELLIKTPDIIFIIITFVLLIISIIIILFGMSKGYLWEFLKAALLNRKLVIEKMRGGPFYTIRTAKQDGDTSIQIDGKKIKSPIFIVPHSMMVSLRGKVPTYFVASKASFTTNFDFQMIIQELEAKIKKPIKNYDEFSAAVKILSNTDPELKIKLPAYKTVNIRDLDYYFPKYLNVEDVDAKIQLKAKKMSLLGKMNMANVTMIAVILIAGALAYLIITKDSQPVVNVVLNASDIIAQNAGTANSGITGFINNTVTSSIIT